ncbi:MAG: NAD(P)-binding domain-containing protein, partial [Clostridia bacterium]|nr:NAD(P)-binding domain-containing protein [Clostridia bacterium]
MRISVLGCGRWGSFIGWYLARHNHEVCQWGRVGGKSFEQLKSGKNEYVELDSRINLTSDLKKALEFGDIIVISISAQSLRSFTAEILKIADVKDKIFVLCMKGIEVETGKRLSEVLKDCGIKGDKIAVWLGPGHIQAFTQNQPNCMVIDSENPELVKTLCDAFRSELIRFYYGDDIIGSEIGAAAKNVMGIAAGMLDGGNLSTLKGPLMSRGAREVA